MINSAVVLDTYGTFGSFTSTSTNTSNNFSPAGFNIGEWKGPLTFSGSTLLAPASFNASPAFATASDSPEITICPGQL